MKRKVFSLILVLSLFALLIPCTASAEIIDSGTCGENLTWKLDDAGTLTISGTGNMKNYLVGYVDPTTNPPWRNVKNVVIENGVTSIGNNAFYYKDITSITIPNSVTNIGKDAFFNCRELTEINVDEGNEYYMAENNVLFNKEKTKLIIAAAKGVNGEYIIPDTVASIDRYAFYNCTDLTRVTIPDGITSISDYAFEGCNSLTSVTMPDSITEIGQHAFCGCNRLTSITIPAGVTSIGTWAFNSCTAIEAVYITDIAKWCEIQFGSESSNPLRYANLYLNDELATNLVIPDSVTSIGTELFYGCTSLTSVIIPNSVTSIGDRSFSCCGNLTSVTIPDSVTSIGNLAFSNCTDLTEINVDEDNEYYIAENNVLFNKEKTELIIAAAKGVNGEYTIPDSVISIDDSAFYGCDNLTSVTIPNGVTSIGDNAFEYCFRLTSVTLPDSVIRIGEYAFWSCSVTSIAIPSGVTEIDYLAFHGNNSLAEITVDNDNKYYMAENNVLFNKEKTKLIIAAAKGVNGEYIIPGTVTSIGNDAFSNCTNLTSVTIPNSVTSISDDSVFSNCSGLAEINVDESNEYYTARNNVLFNKEKTKLIIAAAKGVNGEYIIPDTVTSIGNHAFSNCTDLTSVTIPNSVTHIDYYAFSNCTGLMSVTIPDSVTSINYNAFYKCSNLKDVYYSGSETDREKIRFNGDNDNLINATWHYNSTAPTPVPPTVVEITTMETETDYVFIVKPIEVNESCGVYGIAYSADGRMLDCDLKKLDTESNTIVKVKKGEHIKTVKCFVWTDKLQPIDMKKIEVK